MKRRNFLKTSAVFLTATLWGDSLAVAKEKNMSDSKKVDAAAGPLTDDDIHSVSPALDNGVRPAELSEIITHLAFYAGWGNAMAAVSVAKDVFRQRSIGFDQLPPAKDKLLPLNEEVEKQRANQVGNNFGAVSPGLVQNTTD